MKPAHILLIAIVGLVLIGGGARMAIRGIRNNNPGNLRPLPGGVKWIGQTGVDAGGYLIFDSMVNGVRAMAKDLKTKMGRGLNTIAKIIPVYAPAEDNNNVQAYIASVSGYSGLAPDQVLSLGDLYNLVTAMIRHEVGVAGLALISSRDILKGVQAA